MSKHGNAARGEHPAEFLNVTFSICGWVVLQNNGGEDEIKFITTEERKIRLDIHVIMTMVAEPVIFPGQRHHCLGDIDTVAAVKRPGHRLGQPPDAAAEIEGTTVRWTQITRRVQ
jgi:hypothetical protein